MGATAGDMNASAAKRGTAGGCVVNMGDAMGATGARVGCEGAPPRDSTSGSGQRMGIGSRRQGVLTHWVRSMPEGGRPRHTRRASKAAAAARSRSAFAAALIRRPTTRVFQA